MTKAIYYPGADRTSQWAFGKYPGDAMNTNCVVLHTTETLSWPSYSTGYYPTFTYHRGAKARWRQHLPVNRSARALEHPAGGPATNTANCAQVELVGTCDRSYKNRYGGIYWPEAPDDALEDVARFLAWMKTEWGVRLVAPPKWPAYPQSYGNGAGQRMSPQQWHDFYGVCGHMHVPTNHHGDPGNIDIARLLVMAERISGGQAITPAPKPAPKPTEDTMPTADDIWDHRINPGPTADAIGGYTPDAAYPARDLLVGAEARVRRLEDNEAARYEDLLAKINQVEERVTAKLDAIATRLGGGQ